ncbi:MAG: hypothetical protein JWQ24_4554 [Tardiphaga sp.]|nr:hypothetical protein [Tardiphaga sp.]
MTVVDHNFGNAARPQYASDLAQGLLCIGRMMYDTPRVNQIKSVVWGGQFAVADAQICSGQAINEEALLNVQNRFISQVDAMCVNSCTNPLQKVCTGTNADFQHLLTRMPSELSERKDFRLNPVPEDSISSK